MKNACGLPSFGKEAVDYTIQEITHICQSLGKRAPGSAGEKAAAEYMAGKLKEECGCTRVELEQFSEHPAAFYGYFRFSAFFDILSWAGYFIHPVLSIVSGCCALFLFVFQFLFYRQIIDPLFPKRTGSNVTAVRPCSGEVRQRIFLNGHLDAAWEFPLNHLFGGIVFEIPGVMALTGILLTIGFSICSLAGCGRADTAFPRLAVFVPFFALVAITYNPHFIVDGANDNLSGCYMGIALLHELEQHHISLRHTEVGVILTGSEEAGLRGAKAWGIAHKNDYRDVPTYILSFDTIHDPKYLAVNERDLNGTVNADRELGDLFLREAEQLGIPCKRGWVPPFGGSTDSAAFTQAGFRSVGVTGLNHRLEDYYHTRRDSYDNLNREGLENCYAVTAALVETLDARFPEDGQSNA